MDKGKTEAITIVLCPPGLKQHNDSCIKNKDVFSKSVHIFWASEDSGLVVKARQPKLFFAAGNTFNMSCKVSSKKIRSPCY